jgi:hypothetical protein
VDGTYITEPPWYPDVQGIIYAPNGRAQTTVANLKVGAPAELLATAPDLLQALQEAFDSIDEKLRGMPQTGAEWWQIVQARNQAETAIAHVRYGSGSPPPRRWEISPDLPAAERLGNERPMDAADELYKTAREVYGKAYSVLGQDVSELLIAAISRVRS